MKRKRDQLQNGQGHLVKVTRHENGYLKKNDQWIKIGVQSIFEIEIVKPKWQQNSVNQKCSLILPNIHIFPFTLYRISKPIYVHSDCVF